MKKVSADEAITILLAGGIGVMPTDTLYGLVASARDSEAVERLYALKNRGNKPGTLIAANVEQLITLGLAEDEIHNVAYLWPNPLSIDMRLLGLSYLHQGTHQLAVRVVADKWMQKILLKTGPLMTSSANSPGEPVSTTIEMAQDYFGDTVDFYVDGGDLSSRAPSTIISVKNGQLMVFREGAISKNQLLEIQKANR